MPSPRRRAVPLTIAALALAVVGACGGGGSSEREALCSDQPDSLGAVADNLQAVDNEAGLAVYGPILTNLPDQLRKLDLNGDVALARDRAVRAIDDVQAARAAGNLDEQQIDAAATALRDLDSRLC